MHAARGEGPARVASGAEGGMEGDSCLVPSKWSIRPTSRQGSWAAKLFATATGPFKYGRGCGNTLFSRCANRRRKRGTLPLEQTDRRVGKKRSDIGSRFNAAVARGRLPKFLLSPRAAASAARPPLNGLLSSYSLTGGGPSLMERVSVAAPRFHLRRYRRVNGWENVDSHT